MPTRIIYLDHNATTPINLEVLKEMNNIYRHKDGNASSLHTKGRVAKAVLEESRTVIGDSLGTESVDIIFTSGGTESDNLAIKGICIKNRDKGDHIITSSVEHMAVLETCSFLKDEGFKASYIKVDEYGMVSVSDIEKAITDKTILISIMHANNEVGTIQPIREISALVKNINSQRIKVDKPRIYLHTDAVQSFGKIPVDVEELGVDLLSISSHKIYGPKGVGALYIRKGVEITPQPHGGHHERNMRAGTENIAAIAGFAKAVTYLKKNLKEYERVMVMRDRLYNGLSDRIKDMRLNGHPQKRLPNTVNIGFKDTEEEGLLVNLDTKGICASSGSACTARDLKGSHVLEAMGLPKQIVRGSVRFSLGIDTSERDIEYCIKEIPLIIQRLRSVYKSTATA